MLLYYKPPSPWSLRTLIPDTMVILVKGTGQVLKPLPPTKTQQTHTDNHALNPWRGHTVLKWNSPTTLLPAFHTHTHIIISCVYYVEYSHRNCNLMQLMNSPIMVAATCDINECSVCKLQFVRDVNDHVVPPD